MRLVSWNIRAGGGKRVTGILAQLMGWAPDVIGLAEFRATQPSRWLAEALHNAGYIHQREPQRIGAASINGVFIASRYPLTRIRHQAAPREPNRWLQVRVDCPQRLSVAIMHIPNQVTGRKPDYHRSMLNMAQTHTRTPVVFMGDTNSGRIGIDEQNPVFNKATDQWFEQLNDAGFCDGFRHLYYKRREYTWYSPNHGNGFRLDQVFVNAHARARLHDVQHVWGQNRPSERLDELSDHAALVIDLT